MTGPENLFMYWPGRHNLGPKDNFSKFIGQRSHRGASQRALGQSVSFNTKFYSPLKSNKVLKTSLGMQFQFFVPILELWTRPLETFKTFTMHCISDLVSFASLKHGLMINLVKIPCLSWRLKLHVPDKDWSQRTTTLYLSSRINYDIWNTCYKNREKKI